MTFLDWSALIIGTGLMVSGIRAIYRHETNVPEKYEGKRAVSLGWLWIGLGVLFVLSAVLDISFLKILFQLFLEAAN